MISLISPSMLLAARPSINELNTRVNQLEAQVNALESQVNESILMIAANKPLSIFSNGTRVGELVLFGGSLTIGSTDTGYLFGVDLNNGRNLLAREFLYVSSDCAGQPYTSLIFGENYDVSQGVVFLGPDGTTAYYVPKGSLPTPMVATNSVLRIGSPCKASINEITALQVVINDMSITSFDSTLLPGVITVGR